MKQMEEGGKKKLQSEEGVMRAGMGESKVGPQQHCAGLSSQAKRPSAFTVRVCWRALSRLHVLVRSPSWLYSFLTLASGVGVGRLWRWRRVSCVTDPPL